MLKMKLFIGDPRGRGASRRYIALAVCAILLIAMLTASLVFAAQPSFAEPEEATELTDETSNTDSETDGDEGNAPQSPVSITITKYQREMNVGDESTISYELRNADADAEVEWESSDGNIASVDSDGTVHARAAGKAEITASIGDARASILITVTQPVIAPASFKVDVEEFTAVDALSGTHEMKIGDELHMSAKIEPPDATVNGKFEWRVSGDGIVSIRTDGEIDEVAVLTAKKDGEVTLTVKYVDESADAGERITLDDYRLKISVAEEKPALSPLLIAIFIAVVVAVVIILITIANGRKRQRIEKEHRERAAHKRHAGDARERAKQEERSMQESYERGYRDSEAEQFERITRVYDAPVIPPEPDPAEGDGEPDRPFSEDDIK